MGRICGVLLADRGPGQRRAHSAADTAIEGLLLTALRRSGRRPDRLHPFGYGKERFFWALIAAVSIFVSGAVRAAYKGFRTILSGEQEQTLACVAYTVLGLSFLLEFGSWLQAARQVCSQSRREQCSRAGAAAKRAAGRVVSPAVTTPARCRP